MSPCIHRRPWGPAPHSPRARTFVVISIAALLALAAAFGASGPVAADESACMVGAVAYWHAGAGEIDIQMDGCAYVVAASVPQYVVRVQGPGGYAKVVYQGDGEALEAPIVLTPLAAGTYVITSSGVVNWTSTSDPVVDSGSISVTIYAPTAPAAPSPRPRTPAPSVAPIASTSPRPHPTPSPAPTLSRTQTPVPTIAIRVARPTSAQPAPTPHPATARPTASPAPRRMVAATASPAAAPSGPSASAEPTTAAALGSPVVSSAPSASSAAARLSVATASASGADTVQVSEPPASRSMPTRVLGTSDEVGAPWFVIGIVLVALGVAAIAVLRLRGRRDSR